VVVFVGYEAISIPTTSLLTGVDGELGLRWRAPEGRIRYTQIKEGVAVYGTR
jgi:hypothetical protein